jgi:hypothetical protein
LSGEATIFVTASDEIRHSGDRSAGRRLRWRGPEAAPPP